MIGVLGINHKTAQLDIREQFAVATSEITALGEQVQQKTEITELVVLSTCNRTEIYFFHDKPCSKRTFKLLLDVLHNFKGVKENLSEHFYQLTEAEAVKHLFEVTSGVDSMVLGEDQVVNQVKEAYLHCTDEAMTDAVLMRLFQKSFETGKRVRTDTKIQKGATSVSYVAVEMCANIYKTLADKRVLFVGAGETGALALKNMKRKGVEKIFITNRTFGKAEILAEKFNGIPVDFNEFENHLEIADIVIVATDAQGYLVHKDKVSTSMKKRNDNELIIIDLSVPRNVDKSVGEIDKVRLYGVDDLQEVLKNKSEKRIDCIDNARIIIDEKTQEYFEWFDSRALRPIIKTITSNIHKLHEEDLKEFLKTQDIKFEGTLNNYSDHLAKKYTRSIIKNLKEITKNGNSLSSLKAINKLFMFD